MKLFKIITLILFVIFLSIWLLNNDELQFKFNYWRLEKHRSQSHIQFSSKTSDYNDCAAYHKIVKGGEKNIPFIMEKIIDGDFFLNSAMREITGIEVDIRQLFPEPIVVGEQHESKFWIKWWEENKKKLKIKNEGYPTGGPHYYESWKTYHLPYMPKNLISVEDAKSRESYYEAYFTSERKISKFTKIINGKMAFSVTYTYSGSGILKEGILVKSTGDTIIQKFDENGKLIQ